MHKVAVADPTPQPPEPHTQQSAQRSPHSSLREYVRSERSPCLQRGMQTATARATCVKQLIIQCTAQCAR